MTKAIQYPTQEWLDNWVDKYLDENPNEKVDDFKALEEMAMSDWWDNEIDHNRPTPFDLTPEQEKASKDARMGISSVDKTVKTERKPRERKVDEEKVDLIAKIHQFLVENGLENVKITKKEREIDFSIGENDYTLALTKHRKAKK